MRAAQVAEPRDQAAASTCIAASPRRIEDLMKRMIALACTVLLAGCTGAAEDERPRGEASAPTTSELAEKPPTSLTAGWETDFVTHSVPFAEIRPGGPPKDGIPPIDRPRFVRVEHTRFLAPREPVIAVEVSGEVRAYPIEILIWHEIVNDEIGGVPLAVTFCPLCNTALVFDRRVDGRTLDFGTTGNLRHSDLVMYDRQTESWWQQFGGEGIVGRYTGARLEQVPARIVAWEDFERSHPEGLVLERPKTHPLSRNSGFLRPYGENPYEGYDDVDSSPLFQTANDDDRLSPKERVVFVERGDEAVAIPFAVLEKRRVVRIVVDGHRLVVRWRGGVSSPLDSDAVGKGRDIGAAEVFEEGKLIAFDEPFWFAVAAFRPDVHVVG